MYIYIYIYSIYYIFGMYYIYSIYIYIYIYIYNKQFKILQINILLINRLKVVGYSL